MYSLSLYPPPPPLSPPTLHIQPLRHTPHTYIHITAVEGTLVVQKSTSTIQSVLGCAETFICEGKGNVVEWGVKGLRGDVIPEDLITVSYLATCVCVMVCYEFIPDVSTVLAAPPGHFSPKEAI